MLSSAGLTAVPTWGVEEFVTDVFYWFKNYPSRQEYYMTLHNAMSETDIGSKFVRFVDSRWLSIDPVIDRVTG